MSEEEARTLDALRADGRRVTTARRLVVELLARTSEHLTADDLARRIHDAHPEIHLSTVYRTLERLTELGVINHVHLGHGPAVYHLAGDSHHHLVCDDCGAIVELPANTFDALVRRVERDYGFRLDAHHFALGGHCRNCA